jgi:hypothetical protein
LPTRFSPEQTSLFEAAEFTWQRRGAATSAGMPFGEETITETILLDLKLKYPGKLEIIPFTKPTEGKIGADWEWCFASHDHQFFQRMLVQAKVLDDPETEYAHIDRKIGNTGIRQIDRLIDTSHRRGVPAVYAFYNHVSDISRLPSNCGTIGVTSPNPLPPCWGVSIADAEFVRSRLPDKTFDTLSLESVPLHCILCSGGAPSLGPGGSAASVARALSDLIVEGSGRLRDPRPDPEPSREPPPYFDVAMRLGDIDDPREKEHVREKLAKENPEIDGIAVFVDSRKKESI